MDLPLSLTREVSQFTLMRRLINRQHRAAGFGKIFGSTFAMPGIAEKGYIDVHVEVATAGGHSSIPPDHTVCSFYSSVPITSLIYILVVNWHTRRNVDPLGTTSLRTSFRKEPISHNLCSINTTPHQSRDEPLFEAFRCFAEHGEDMPDELRRLIARSKTSDRALNALTNEVSKNRLFKSLAGTTQAIDIIHGGVKANALPEQAYALVNHRIAVTRFGSCPD